MNYFKHKYGDKEFKEREMKINVAGSFFAGGIAAGLTNPLECITVNKQTNMDFNIKEFVKQEGIKNVCLKGLGPRVAYNCLQSIVFFTMVLELGKLYNVNLGEE